MFPLFQSFLLSYTKVMVHVEDSTLHRSLFSDNDFGAYRLEVSRVIDETPAINKYQIRCRHVTATQRAILSVEYSGI